MGSLTTAKKATGETSWRIDRQMREARGEIGSGHYRAYSFDDVCWLMVGTRLKAVGATSRFIATVLENLSLEHLHEQWLAIEDNGSVHAVTTREVARFASERNGWIVNMDKIASEVRSKFHD